MPVFSSSRKLSKLLWLIWSYSLPELE